MTVKEKKQIEKDLNKAREIISKHKRDRDSLIPVLQDIQDKFGCLPEHILREVSLILNVPLSGIYGVITFYAQFHLSRRGKNIIKCCVGTACHVKGAEEIIRAIRSKLKLKDGSDTTNDYKFTLEAAMCLGTCFLAPVIMVNNDYYGNLTPEEIPGILESYN